MEQLTPGVRVEVKDNKLKLEADLKDLGPSASGKTTLYATTRGNVAIPGTDFKLGLTVFKK